MKAVNEYLKQLGLSEIETKLYLGLLELGSTTVMELANHVGIKRITAHFNVESLIDKGLIAETRKGARRQIVAESPDKLETVLSERELEIGQLKHNLPSIIQTITRNIPKAKTSQDVEIRYYEGKKAVMNNVYTPSLEAEEVYSFVNLDKYYEVFPNTASMFWESLNKNKKRKVWDIAIDSPLARNLGEGHERYFCKFMEPSKFFSGFDILIHDSSVAIIQLEEGNTSATVIESELISLSFKTLHNSMWKLI